MRTHVAFIAVFAVSAVALLPGGPLPVAPVAAKNSTIVREIVKLGDLEVPVALMAAIEKSDQKAAILDYLSSTRVSRASRLQFLETVRQTLLPDRPDLAPKIPQARSVQHGDLEIPASLMAAIEKSEQKAAILEYLASPQVKRENRLQYLETVRQTLLPEERPAPKVVAKAANADNPKNDPKVEPKKDPKNAEVILVSPQLLRAIMKSGQSDAIMEYLDNSAVPVEKRRQYLETVRQTLLPDEKK